MRISHHAMKRTVERNGISKKAAQRLVEEKVIIKGIPAEQTSGKLRRWTDGVYSRSKVGVDTIFLYGDRAYLFKNENLITVLIVPGDCVKTLNRMKQKTVA